MADARLGRVDGLLKAIDDADAKLDGYLTSVTAGLRGHSDGLGGYHGGRSLAPPCSLAADTHAIADGLHALAREPAASSATAKLDEQADSLDRSAGAIVRGCKHGNYLIPGSWQGLFAPATTTLRDLSRKLSEPSEP